VHIYAEGYFVSFVRPYFQKFIQFLPRVSFAAHPSDPITGVVYGTGVLCRVIFCDFFL